MNILLFGKDGQVGHELQRTLLPFGNIIALGRSQVDLTDGAQIQEALDTHDPAIIVNAAAYTAVDTAETDEATATQVNRDAVAVMARYAKESDALLVHYSTDYVYNGEKAGAYVETDQTDPQSVYGRTKLAGEQAILDSGCQAFIFRTSWVFSSHGANFVKTVIRLAKERDTLGIVADQIGAPTSAELIADVTALAIAADKQDALAHGIYHLTASGETSWHGLATHIVERVRHHLPLKLDSSKIKAIGTADYPLPAKRPKNSRLDTSKLSAALDLNLPDWHIHVDRALHQLHTTE